MKTILKALLLVGIFGLTGGCDPDGKKKCQWVLEPEPALRDKVDPGFIPVCARNRTTQKQDCRMQATMEFAKEAYEKKFRYVDIRIKNPGLPRTITGIDFCNKG